MKRTSKVDHERQGGFVSAATTLVVWALLSGCASSGGSSGPAAWGAQTSSREPVTLDVTNNHWADMRIYCVVDGTRIRLGSVSSIDRATFRLPPMAQTGGRQIRFLAVPLGERRAEYLSTDIMAEAGDRVMWELNHHLPLSSLYIRR